uniref:Uncharacterized protein n=1 Tax=Anguilla anguilla TaxID=7936 RepID=A0A0E9R9S5_ANGAN
MLKDKEKRRS